MHIISRIHFAHEICIMLTFHFRIKNAVSLNIYARNSFYILIYKSLPFLPRRCYSSVSIYSAELVTDTGAYISKQKKKEKRTAQFPLFSSHFRLTNGLGNLCIAVVKSLDISLNSLLKKFRYRLIQCTLRLSAI